MQKAVIVAAILGTIALATPSRAATPDQFMLRSTSDLVSICSTSPTDNISSASTGFCHGFMVGAYRTLEIVQQAKPQSDRMFCPADLPSRTEAIDAYMKWANARPDELSKPPVDSIATYLATTYPCPATGHSGKSSSRRSQR